LAAAPVAEIDLVAREQAEASVARVPDVLATVPGASLLDPLVGTGAPGSADVQQSETDEQFWATVDAQPWWRRRKKAASSAVVLQVAAGLTAAVAVAIHFA
jgi:hypothetical protein